MLIHFEIIIAFAIQIFHFNCLAIPVPSNTTQSLVDRTLFKQPTKMLERPDHLVGVKIERDGDINPNFRKEILGIQNTTKTPEDALAEIFDNADSDKNGLLSVRELSAWIIAKINSHLNQAIKENIHMFMAVDSDRNGLATWDEYHVRYLLDRGFELSYAVNHSEKHKTMPRKLREEILVEKAAWNDALHTNLEGLNIDEFLSFRHPEHSHVTLLNMVTEIFDRLDSNRDDKLSEEEFSQVPANENLDRPVNQYHQEKLDEFRQHIDANGDKVVSRHELMVYSDPKNPKHAETEARDLIRIADGDGNDELSLTEILAHKDEFLNSKMYDIAKSFHDEF